MKVLAFIIAVMAGAVLLLTFSLPAHAASHDARLDTVATAIAGHPVVAVCADSTVEWATWETQVAGGIELDGFTQLAVGPNIYLAPHICKTLLAGLQVGPTAVGIYWYSLAIKTILHEAVHQRGITDEGMTDCTALTLVRQYALSSFGFTLTVPKTVIASKLVKGKRVYFTKTITVPNPALAMLDQYAHAWHAVLPANYQGGC